MTDTVIHSSGVVATARQQGYTKQLEKPYASLGEKSRSKVDAITGKTGKGVEDERVTDGAVLAMKWSNFHGVKSPCC